MDWREYLLARLKAWQPEQLCALDSAAQALAHSALPASTITPPGQSPQPSCTIALGVDALNALDVQQARQLINQTRLYVAPRMLLVAPEHCALDDTAFRALGFMLIHTDTPNHTHLYHYDLDAYKTVPDWLNARYWAHPERWEP